MTLVIHYYNHIHVNVLILSVGTDYWTNLLFCSQPVSAGQMERGDGTGSLGGTTDPLPLPISCTNNMPHAS